MHDAARACLARGWSVIPIERRGKRPLVAWLEFQDRLATPDELEAWLARWPEANLGIVTGRISGLVVVDVDAGHGGEASLARLEAAHGPLPGTVEALTGGGGRHLYFAHPGGRVGNRVGLLPGIDLRGDGGCVVAPPSIHPNGRRYAWADGRAPQEAPLAPLPAWLLRDAGARRAGHPLAHWRELARRGVGEGERNATLASLAGHLLWHEVDPEVVLELLLAWNRARCDPPLDDAEVASVVESITRLHLGERGGPRP
jgi:Bifunctional DNA primase/polymerase, N-terminal/Primase C terminal 1 (PriCT-1)